MPLLERRRIDEPKQNKNEIEDKKNTGRNDYRTHENKKVNYQCKS